MARRLALLAVLITGCGGSGQAPPPAATATPAAEAAPARNERYIDGLNKATVRSRRAFRRLNKVETDRSDEFAAYLVGIGRLQARFAEDVAKLEPDPVAAEEHRAYVDAILRSADAYRAAGRAGLSHRAGGAELSALMSEALAADRAVTQARLRLSEKVLP